MLCEIISWVLQEYILQLWTVTFQQLIYISFLVWRLIFVLCYSPWKVLSYRLMQCFIDQICNNFCLFSLANNSGRCQVPRVRISNQYLRLFTWGYFSWGPVCVCFDITAFAHLEDKPKESSSAARMEGSSGLLCNKRWIRRHQKCLLANVFWSQDSGCRREKSHRMCDVHCDFLSQKTDNFFANF